MTTESAEADVVLIGGGIMSATLAVLLQQVRPDWSIVACERLDEVGEESSNGWHNAGTGHAGLCELNYTPQAADGSIEAADEPRIMADAELIEEAGRCGAGIAGPVEGSELNPHARGVARVMDQVIAAGECDVDAWEPVYGRLAEAQVKWEGAHGRRLA